MRAPWILQSLEATYRFLAVFLVAFLAFFAFFAIELSPPSGEMCAVGLPRHAIASAAWHSAPPCRPPRLVCASTAVRANGG